MDGSQQVLVVEDDTTIRESLREALTDEGYSVATARHGREALQSLRDGVAPCVMLLDLMMPVMNGWQLLEVMRKDQSLSRIPVVVVSASHEVAEPAGAVRFMSKPLDLLQLLAEVALRCRGCAAPPTD